jgi:hypothetical protein
MHRLLSVVRRSLNRTSRTTSTQSLPYHLSSTCTCTTTSATTCTTTQPPTPSNTHRRTYQTSAAPHQASTFVSAHFRIEEKTITDFLKRIKAKFRRTTTHLILEECPSCSPHKNKQDNKWKLYVSHQNNGAYFCHRCGEKGSWYDLKGAMTGKPGASTMHKNTEVTHGDQKPGGNSSKYSSKNSTHPSSPQAQPHALPLPDQHLAGTFPKQLMEKTQYASLLHYLTEERGLTTEILSKYCVGASDYSFRGSDGLWTKQACMTFPWISTVGNYTSASGETGVQWQITRVKARALEHKHMQRLEPAGGGWGLFGLHTVPDNTKSIVLTEGEFDAMAVHQATGVPAVSLPNGCNSLPVVRHLVHCCLLFAVCCLLFAVCCLLFAVCCLLFDSVCPSNPNLFVCLCCVHVFAVVVTATITTTNRMYCHCWKSLKKYIYGWTTMCQGEKVLKSLQRNWGPIDV